MGILLMFLGLVGIGLKGFSKAMNEADTEGVFKKSVQGGAVKLINRLFK